MIISGDLLHSYLNSEPPLVEGIGRDRIQPNGVDISIENIFKFEGYGAISVNRRELPNVNEIEPDSDGWWQLKYGSYRVRLREIVHLPLGVVGIARPRSTLIRCGASVHTALWDSGYEGKSEVLLTVHNPNGLRLQRGARIMQMIFILCQGKVGEGYSGIYQKENM